jgi:hypothetical protein
LLNATNVLLLLQPLQLAVDLVALCCFCKERDCQLVKHLLDATSVLLLLPTLSLPLYCAACLPMKSWMCGRPLAEEG